MVYNTVINGLKYNFYISLYMTLKNYQKKND